MNVIDKVISITTYYLGPLAKKLVIIQCYRMGYDLDTFPEKEILNLVNMIEQDAGQIIKKVDADALTNALLLALKPIYRCSLEKNVENCLSCPQYDSCEIRDKILTAPKYRVTAGHTHLLKTEGTNKCYEIYKDLISRGIKGMCITRRHPTHVMENYGLKTPMRWLNATPGKNNIHPTKLALLVSIIKEFVDKTENSVVLLDGLEYIIVHNNFQQALRMVEYLNETMMVNQSRLIIPIDPRTLDVRELALLERNMEVIED